MPLRDPSVRAIQSLIAGKMPTGEDLPRVDGRIDLRGVRFPSPEVTGRLTVGHSVFDEITGRVELKREKLEHIDFSGASLGGVMLTKCRIVDCVFDEADCGGIGLWGTTVSDSRFTRASLRGAQIGAPWRRHQNRFTGVSFEGADMAGLYCTRAAFVDCDFVNAQLRDIDFGASSFERCRFAGELYEVRFRAGQPKRGFTVNAMTDVDFADAELRWSDFWGLDLDRVVWPTSPGHVIVGNYRSVLAETLTELANRPDLQELGYTLVLETALRRAGPNQHVGLVLHEADLLEGDEPELVAAMVELVRDVERKCSAEPAHRS